MAVPFSNTRLRVPKGFQNVLEGLAREVLRCQPPNICAFAEAYFEELLRKRQETGYDDVALLGAKLEDRFYNNYGFNNPNINTNNEEQQTAAVKIQAEYRRFAAKKEVDTMKEEDAATVIQASYRGYMERQDVDNDIVFQQNGETEDLQEDSEDKIRGEAEEEVKPDSTEENGAPVKEFSTEDLDDEERRHSAAVKIQANFKGYTTRKKYKEGGLSDENVNENFEQAEKMYVNDIEEVETSGIKDAEETEISDAKDNEEVDSRGIKDAEETEISDAKDVEEVETSGIKEAEETEVSETKDSEENVDITARTDNDQDQSNKDKGIDDDLVNAEQTEDSEVKASDEIEENPDEINELDILKETGDKTEIEADQMDDLLGDTEREETTEQNVSESLDLGENQNATDDVIEDAQETETVTEINDQNEEVEVNEDEDSKKVEQDIGGETERGGDTTGAAENEDAGETERTFEATDEQDMSQREIDAEVAENTIDNMADPDAEDITNRTEEAAD